MDIPDMPSPVQENKDKLNKRQETFDKTQRGITRRK
jgi:hypothetical protein